MPAGEFAVILPCKIARPRVPKRGIALQPIPFLSRRDYATIRCNCESFFRFVIHFLRPDTDWPWDSGSLVKNSYDPVAKTAVAYLRAYEYSTYDKLLKSGEPVVAYGP